MIKGLDTKLGELRITGTKNDFKRNRARLAARMTDDEVIQGIYHGRTELGVGQHDQIKKRLDEERHQEYKNHIDRKEMERRMKTGNGDGPTVREESAGSVCDIGYETSMNIAHQRKQLNDVRKAEYVAHLAAQSASVQTDRHDGRNGFTQTVSVKQQDADTNTNQQFEMSERDDRKQKQRDYAEALRQQIADKKITTDRIKRKEKEDDKKNMEMAQGSNQGFNYGSYSQNFNNSSP